MCFFITALCDDKKITWDDFEGCFCGERLIFLAVLNPLISHDARITSSS